MILPDRVLGRPGANWITSGEAIGPISLRTWATSSLRRSSIAVMSLHEGHVGVNALALTSWGKPTTAASETQSMRHERAFDLGGAHAMARDIETSSTRPVIQ